MSRSKCQRAVKAIGQLAALGIADQARNYEKQAMRPMWTPTERFYTVKQLTPPEGWAETEANWLRQQTYKFPQEMVDEGRSFWVREDTEENLNKGIVRYVPKKAKAPLVRRAAETVPVPAAAESVPALQPPQPDTTTFIPLDANRGPAVEARAPSPEAVRKRKQRAIVSENKAKDDKTPPRYSPAPEGFWTDLRSQVTPAELQQHLLIRNEGPAWEERIYPVLRLKSFFEQAKRENLDEFSTQALIAERAQQSMAWLMPFRFEDGGRTFIRMKMDWKDVGAGRAVDGRTVTGLIPVAIYRASFAPTERPYSIPQVTPEQRVANEQYIQRAKTVAQTIATLKPDLATQWMSGVAKVIEFAPAALAKGWAKFLWQLPNGTLMQMAVTKLRFYQYTGKPLLRVEAQLDGIGYQGSVHINDLRANHTTFDATFKRIGNSDMRGQLQLNFAMAEVLAGWESKLANEGLGKLGTLGTFQRHRVNRINHALNITMTSNEDATVDYKGETSPVSAVEFIRDDDDPTRIGIYVWNLKLSPHWTYATVTRERLASSMMHGAPIVGLRLHNAEDRNAVLVWLDAQW